MSVQWWRTYENALARNEVKWRGFDEWVRTVKVSKLPYAEIPINREVKYEVPRPVVAARKTRAAPQFISR